MNDFRLSDFLCATINNNLVRENKTLILLIPIPYQLIDNKKATHNGSLFLLVFYLSIILKLTFEKINQTLLSLIRKFHTKDITVIVLEITNDLLSRQLAFCITEP